MPNGTSPRPYGSLNRIAVTVPDPQATARFLADGFDFEVRQEGDRLLVVCGGDYGTDSGQGAIELAQGPGHVVERVVFGVHDAADLDDLAAAIGGKRAGDTSVRVTDPTGIVVSLEPWSTLRVAAPPPSVLRPRRMGHVNLKTPCPPQTAEFFTERLHLRLSEYIGEALYWMRTDTEHHAVALRPGEPSVPHHLGLEIPGWHAYQPLLDHLGTAGYTVEYGPGRHRPGRSLFSYVADPSSGLRIELYADMVHITDPDAPPIGWEPGDRLTKTLNTWGPTPPESFLA
ncbi:VOC family protein [Streptomyces sp. 6N223]|uniref:VOC family protein n=1 Tax=Streptomyces sp. 6N223 TaxID=3457412 RepID=UPI003FD67E98